VEVKSVGGPVMRRRGTKAFRKTTMIIVWCCSIFLPLRQCHFIKTVWTIAIGTWVTREAAAANCAQAERIFVRSVFLPFVAVVRERN
jgi:hypothetical protein